LKALNGLFAGLLLMTGVSTGAIAQEINFYDTMSAPPFVKWWQTKGVPACEAAAGAKVNYTSGASAEVLQRITAAQAGQGDIDILMLGPDKMAQFKTAGVVTDLRTLGDLVPNLAKTEGPDVEAAIGVPLEGTGAQFFRYSYALIYNEQFVPEPPNTWNELYERRDEWKGRISYIDPRSAVSGAGRFYTAAFLRAMGSDLGVTDGQPNATWDDAWAKLREFETANATKHAESGGAHAAQFTTGEIWLGFHALDFVAGSKRDGLLPPSVKTVLLEDGMPGGAGYLAIVNNVPDADRDAAAKFIDCALSDEVQTMMVAEMFQFPGTNVWDKLPASVYEQMPTRDVMMKARGETPSADAIKVISDNWA
jgi:ABC-type uncharacterized transport system YnjBCD substrate-binding protein